MRGPARDRKDSDQPLRPQAYMIAAADDHMIVNHYAEVLTSLGDPGCNRNVGAAGLRIAARMVVHQDQGSRTDVETLSDDLARVDRPFVDRAVMHHHIGNEPILRVKIQHANTFVVQTGHVDSQIIEQSLPTGENGLIRYSAARHEPCCKTNALERRCARLTDTLYRLQGARVGIENRRKRSEPCDQCFRGRLGISLAHAGEEQEFEKFVVGQSIGAT